MNQITLRLRPHEKQTFESFRIGLNDSLLDRLRSSNNVWLHGSRSVGKSHVVNALVNESTNAILVSEPSYDLSGLEQFSLVVFDDIEQWLGEKERELQFLGLYERLRSTTGRVVATASKQAARHEFALRDLESRMRAFHEVHLLALPEEQRIGLLGDMAADRGIEISQEVANFLLVRIGRSQHELLDTLEKLDDASAIDQRRLTIPFVKRALQL
ncbi:MAG: DnaA/Hda family protein [Gammaproteobacteria bacterium]|nr:DnaA/Hda family protein [Gammaproteobacteria bacterium]